MSKWRFSMFTIIVRIFRLINRIPVFWIFSSMFLLNLLNSVAKKIKIEMFIPAASCVKEQYFVTTNKTHVTDRIFNDPSLCVDDLLDYLTLGA